MQYPARLNYLLLVTFTILTLHLPGLRSRAQARQVLDFSLQQDSLKRMASQITLPDYDFERLAANYDFREYFRQVLSDPTSMQFPFDSLNTVSKLTAPDGSFRIITWYVPLENGLFEYFGFFQSKPSRNDYFLYDLHDPAGERVAPVYETLEQDQWYGAYYTELIYKRHRRKDHYVLLGWRGDNKFTRKRVIEPIKLLGRGRPSFGKPVFRYQDNRYRRIIFEYSAQSGMILKYEPQAMDLGKRSGGMIIFDRLAPTQSFLKGNYRFYVPEANLYDGFIFDEGKWIFTEDIDARNPRREPRPLPVPQ